MCMDPDLIHPNSLRKRVTQGQLQFTVGCVQVYHRYQAPNALIRHRKSITRRQYVLTTLPVSGIHIAVLLVFLHTACCACQD